MRKTGIPGVFVQAANYGKAGGVTLVPVYGMHFAIHRKNQEESAGYLRYDERFWAIPSVVEQATTE